MSVIEKMLLPFTPLYASSANNTLVIFFLFFPGNRICLSCKLSPICMKGQIVFSGKNKKSISRFHLLKIISRVLSLKLTDQLKKIISVLTGL